MKRNWIRRIATFAAKRCKSVALTNIKLDADGDAAPVSALKRALTPRMPRSLPRPLARVVPT
ncbi:MAG: hypothetical protein ABIW85_03535 [Variovorax sp.]